MSILREEVALACNWLNNRLEQAIPANRDFIEKNYFSIFNKHCQKKLCFYLVFKYVFMIERKKRKKRLRIELHPMHPVY